MGVKYFGRDQECGCGLGEEVVRGAAEDEEQCVYFRYHVNSSPVSARWALQLVIVLASAGSIRVGGSDTFRIAGGAGS